MYKINDNFPKKEKCETVFEYLMRYLKQRAMNYYSCFVDTKVASGFSKSVFDVNNDSLFICLYPWGSDGNNWFWVNTLWVGIWNDTTKTDNVEEKQDKNIIHVWNLTHITYWRAGSSVISL